MKNLINPVNYFLLLFMSWFLAIQAFAQNVQYRDPTNPDRGFWQIVTDPGTKSTVIRFFDGQKNQLYVETIAGKYIKLTNRNITRINKTFDQVVLKSMIATQVKADPLSSPAFRKMMDRQTKKKNKIKNQLVSANHNASTQLKVHAYQTGKTATINLIFQNPEQRRVIIFIKDKLGQYMYHESMSGLHYRRKFNFAGMEYGHYQLVVTTADRKEKYSKIIEYTPQLQLFKEEQPDLMQQISKELANR